MGIPGPDWSASQETGESLVPITWSLELSLWKEFQDLTLHSADQGQQSNSKILPSRKYLKNSAIYFLSDSDYCLSWVHTNEGFHSYKVWGQKGLVKGRQRIDALY